MHGNVAFVYPPESEIHISVPNRQNTVRLIFRKNELGAFSETLRPPLSIAGSIMTLAGLLGPLIEAQLFFKKSRSLLLSKSLKT